MTAAPITRPYAATLIPDDLNEHVDPLDQQKPVISHTALLIMRVQEALKTLGYYEGEVSGELDGDTDTAIRNYQTSKNVSVTGIANEALAEELETAVSVNALLHRLSIARETRTKEAREALLSNPATRDLILENASDAVADPTRDPTQCFAAPTVRCLLNEALENAKAVSRDNMRNWAYSDILVSQARAGLSDDARNTVKHISDPRMILTALGEIAESQARAGQAEFAIAAAEAIPDMETRLESYANMALIFAKRGHMDGVHAVATKLGEHVESTELTVKLASHQARASAALFQIGDDENAWAMLRFIEDTANAHMVPTHRDTALRYVADTLANAGYVEEAISVLANIEDTNERLPVLMSAARAEALDGDPEIALAMANSIDAVRYRSLVLVSIAEGQAKMGQTLSALATLQDATEEMSAIQVPFAKDFAVSRISLAYAFIAASSDPPDDSAFQKAREHAQLIGDDRLAAYTVWKIAFVRNGTGFDIAEEDAKAAMAVTEKIHSPSGRVWLLAELAEDRADTGDGNLAWNMFDRAMILSVPITNTWGKSRALSRLALSLIRLVETDIRRDPVD